MATKSTRPKLEVTDRAEHGSRASRRLRRSGFVPGILYGGDGDPRPFKVGARELRHALLEGSQVLDLQVDGGSAVPVIVKDQHRHPLRGETLHVDLLQVNLNVKIQTTVTVDLEGGEDAPGAKEGGVLEQVTRELNVEALPTDLPERIVVDVSGMEAAATMLLSALTPPPGVEFIDDPDETVIATITIPAVLEEPEVEEETELVGEGEAEAVEGEEAVAQAEGATAEEAESAGDEG